MSSGATSSAGRAKKDEGSAGKVLVAMGVAMGVAWVGSWVGVVGVRQTSDQQRKKRSNI